MLGAGTAKVARILRCSNAVAKKTVESFIANTQGLGKLKSGRIRRDAARGYFEGLDGRYVINDSEYLMLAGYLQNGEAVIMKHWANAWVPEARAQGINFKVVNFVHDEIQTEVIGDRTECDRLIDIQAQAMDWVANDLGLFCPLGVESKVGKTWLDTH